MEKRKRGQPKKLKSPEFLWECFLKYKKETKADPKVENFWSHRHEKQVSVDRETPLLWIGFSSWLMNNDILSHIEEYKTNSGGVYNEFSNIIHKIDHAIKDDQIKGAAAGTYKENIIARIVGLAEKTENTNKLEGTPAMDRMLEAMAGVIENKDKKKLSNGEEI